MLTTGSFFIDETFADNGLLGWQQICNHSLLVCFLFRFVKISCALLELVLARSYLKKNRAENVRIFTNHQRLICRYMVHATLEVI